MTPKEKAKELVEKFQFETKQSEVLNRIILGDISVKFSMHMAKKSALIAVDEMIDMLMTMNKYMVFPQQVIYYQEVKNEINQL